MKILSKHKDYWHYLTGVYGEDPKIVYNMTNSCGIIESDTKGYILELHICDYKYLGVYFEGKYHWDIPTLTDFTFNRNDVIYSNYWTIADYLVADEKLYGRWWYDEKKLKTSLIKSPGRPSTFNKEHNVPILKVLRNGRDEPYDFKLNPVLVKTNIISIISPEEMFLKVTDWLAYQEPELKLDPKDLNRFESKGFDKKTSFRKM